MVYTLTLTAALLGCPLETIDLPMREKLAVASRPVADGESPEVPADGRAAITAAVDACAAQHKWSADQRWEASGYAINTILRDEMARIATTRGVDPAKVEAAVRGMEKATRSPLESSKPEHVTALRIALTAQGIAMDDAPRANVSIALARAWMWLLFLTAES